MRKSGVPISTFIIWNSKMYLFNVGESREWSDLGWFFQTLLLNSFSSAFVYIGCGFLLSVMAISRTEGDLYSTTLAMAQWVTKENIGMLLDVSLPVLTINWEVKVWRRRRRRRSKALQIIATVLKVTCAERQQEQTGRGAGIQSLGWG